MQLITAHIRYRVRGTRMSQNVCLRARYRQNREGRMYLYLLLQRADRQTREDLSQSQEKVGRLEPLSLKTPHPVLSMHRP